MKTPAVNIFGAYPNDRTHVFVDGRNMFYACGSVGFDLDYVKIVDYLAETSRFVRGYYYTMIGDARNGDQGLLGMLEMLEHNRYDVFTREFRVFDADTDRPKFRGTTDLLLAVDFFRIAASGSADHLILMSGNNEFAPIVAMAKAEGVRVSVVAATQGDEKLLGDELRREADTVIELGLLRDNFFRRERTATSDRQQGRGPVARDGAFSPVTVGATA